MTLPSDDHALDVLIDLLRREEHGISETLVRQCYEVEKTYQYDRDRDVPLDRIRRLVEAEVNKHFDDDVDEGAASK